MHSLRRWTTLLARMSNQQGSWRLRSHTFELGHHTLVMGILNVTPDSFSDGGSVMVGEDVLVSRAIERGLSLVSDGADIVDVGGESTRPGSTPVSGATELERVIPVIEGLDAAGVVVSVDTFKPDVARAAVVAGAQIINDVTGFTDPAMVEVAVDVGAGVVAMHMQGSPHAMPSRPVYRDVVEEVRGFLQVAGSRLVGAGLDPLHIAIDPGIGFGKTFHHNMAVLADLGSLVELGYPVLLGASRKGLLGLILESQGFNIPPAGRDPATDATTALAISQGVSIVRVHNVACTVQVARVADAIVATRINNISGSERSSWQV